MKKAIFAVVLYFFSFAGLGQDQIKLNKIEPPFWFDGFHDRDLLLLVYGNNISKTDVSFSAEGIVLERVITTEDSGYLLLQVHFTAPPSPGNYPITFTHDKKFITEYLFEIRPGPAPALNRKAITEPVIVFPSSTDLFRIDNDLQPNLDTIHSRGKQLVFSSGSGIGSGHPWASVPPSPGWLTANKTSRSSEIRIMSNPYTDRYLVQKCMWWTAVLLPDAVCITGQGEVDQAYFEMIRKALGKEFPDLPVIKGCTLK